MSLILPASGENLKPLSFAFSRAQVQNDTAIQLIGQPDLTLSQATVTATPWSTGSPGRWAHLGAGAGGARLGGALELQDGVEVRRELRPLQLPLDPRHHFQRLWFGGGVVTLHQRIDSPNVLLNMRE